MKNVKLDQIVLGDCLSTLKKLPNESIDLIVSSPPYNVGKEYENKKNLDVYLEEQTKVLTECVRVLKTTGSIFWQVGSYSNNGLLIPLDIRFFPILESLGMNPINRIIWVRQHGLHSKKKYSGRHETVLWFSKSKDYKFFLDPIRVPQKYKNKKSYKGDNKGKLSCNPNGKNPGDIWIFRNVKHNHEEQTIHPCQFPEDFISRIILSTTEENDVVFDPYMGTGTVAVVSKENNRRFLGTELDKKYFDVSLRRLKGEPDENNSFPNLKTLRDYINKTGESIEKYKFDVQVSKNPTDRSQSKIYSESYHLEELEKRLSFEEESFSNTLRGKEPPADYFKGGKIKLSKNLQYSFDNLSE